MSIDKLLDRNNPEQQLNKFTGWLPGIVLDLDDPRKLGRVRVKCPLIDNDKPLPNNNDGWIQMLNPSSGGGSPGGTQDLIQAGDQIVLLPMLGDIRQCIGIGVLHSIADPPSPHFDRNKGIYGSHTRNGDIEVKDEQNKRSLRTFNGNTEIIDSAGNRTIESPKGAKMTLGAGGDVRLENQKGTIGVGADGAMTLSNGSATFGFNAKGEISLGLGSTSGIKFTEFGTYISGQKDEVARNLSLVKEGALATLSQFPTWSIRLAALSEELAEDLEYDARLGVIYQIDELLEIMIPGLANITTVLTPLDRLAKSSALEIGTKAIGQIDRFRSEKLTGVSQRYLGGVKQDEIDRLESDLRELVDEKVLNRINIPELQARLEGLQHDPEQQLKAVLESIVPLDRIDAVIGAELHKNIARLDSFKRRLDELGVEDVLNKIDSFGEEGSEKLTSAFEAIAKVSDLTPPLSPATTKAMVVNLKGVTGQVRAVIDTLKGNLDRLSESIAQVDELRTNIDFEEEMGRLAIEKINVLFGCVEAVTPGYKMAIAIEALTTVLLDLANIDEEEKLTALNEAVTAVSGVPLSIDNDSLDGAITLASTTILRTAIALMIETLDDGMSVGLTVLKDLDATISSNTTTGGVDITEEGALNTSDSGATGGNVAQDKERAGIYGPGANRGVGAKVTAQSDAAILAAAGSDADLGAMVVAKPSGIDLKAPGAELGLGMWYEINQRDAYFYAPGAKQDLGSSIYLNQEQIDMYAPGGRKGAGSSFTLKIDEVGLYAPGGDKGSSLMLDTERASLYSPGGKGTGGTKLRLTPDKASLIYPGVGAGNISLSNNRIKIDLPMLQNSVEVTPTGISVRSMLASVRVSQVAIDLTVGGTGIKILPGVVLVNGVPLVPGGNIF